MARFLQWLGAGLGLCLSVGIGMGAGCSAGGDRTTGAGGSGGDEWTGGHGNTSSSSSGNTSSSGGGGFNMGDGGLPACATFSAKATQAPAAMIIVLDGSASMNNVGKWSAAQLAIIGAIDKDVFDTMSLGLMVFPSAYMNPPACICSYIGVDQATCNQLLAPGVSCGVSVLPQVPMAEAGTDKSNAATGVRRQIYDWLVGHNPLSNGDDGSPIYQALKNSYDVLKLQNIDRRIAVLITDGGFSCTSVASPPRAGYADGYGCPDWEYPASVNALISGARTDPSKPINTFIVGVPGSNSVGQKDGTFDTAPYNMLLALSTYSVSGSPDTVDPACSKDAVFMQGASAPAKPCHLDLSTGPFDANVLADAISKIRGAALGCVYDLPPPPAGQTIDKATVNVNITIDGVTITLPKRKDPLDLCTVDGCWDYTPDDKVRIYGKTCDDLNDAKAGKVDIYVGCETILK